MTEVPPPLIITFIHYGFLLVSMCVMQSFGFNHTATPIATANTNTDVNVNMTSAIHSTTSTAETAATTIAVEALAVAVNYTIPSWSPSSSSSTSSSTSISRSTSTRTSNSIWSTNNNNTTKPKHGSTRRTSAGTPFSSSSGTSAAPPPNGPMIQVPDSNHATSLPLTSTLAPSAQISSTATVTASNALWPSSPSTATATLLNSTTPSSSGSDAASALFVRVPDSSSYAANLRYHQHNVNTWGPHFEDVDSTNTNVTVTEGEDVLLDCRVGLLGDKLVSWVRRKSNQLELLTFGSTNHSADARIFSDFKYPNNWRLSIRNTTGNDSGVYLCQISTHPPKVLEVELTVQAPRVFIVNSRGERINEVHYKEGSTLQLICTVNNIMSKTMNWFRNKDFLNQDVVRGGVSIKTDMTSSDQAKSVLRVAAVTRKDGGTYLCSAPPQNASVTVHILVGENPAELYRNRAPGLLRPSASTVSLVLYWIYALQATLALLERSWIQLSLSGPAIR